MKVKVKRWIVEVADVPVTVVHADDYDSIANLLRNVMESGCFQTFGAESETLEKSVLEELEYAGYPPT